MQDQRDIGHQNNTSGRFAVTNGYTEFPLHDVPVLEGIQAQPEPRNGDQDIYLFFFYWISAGNFPTRQKGFLLDRQQCPFAREPAAAPPSTVCFTSRRGTVT
jgi:hypothetical protein